MIIECPKCKSTFKLADSSLNQSITNFKCSVCNHVWENKKKALSLNSSSYKTIKPYKFLLFLNGFLIILTTVALFFFKDQLSYTDEYWKELYNFFQYLKPIK